MRARFIAWIKKWFYGGSVQVVPKRNPLIINCRPPLTDWSKITPVNKSGTHFRTGGSPSMWAYNRIEDVPQVIQGQKYVMIYTEKSLNEFAQACKVHDKKVIHSVNINDTVENSVHLIDRMLARGIQITHFILGNELYLPKFSTQTANVGMGLVTKFTTEDLREIMMDYATRLKYDWPNIKVCLSGAMLTGRLGADKLRTAHNNAFKQMFTSNPQLFDGWDVHVYRGKDGANGEELGTSLPLSSLNHFPGFILFAETGHYEVDNTTAGLALYDQFNKQGQDYCKKRNDGSMWGLHVLHNDNPKDAPWFQLYTRDGISYLGQHHNSHYS